MGKVTLVIVLSLLGMNETGRSADSVRVPNGYVNLASEASAKDETARRIAAENHDISDQRRSRSKRHED